MEKFEGEKPGEQTIEMQRLREILNNPDLPIWIQAHLNPGDKLLDHTKDHHGYQDFVLNKSRLGEFFPDRPSVVHQNIFSRSYPLLEKIPPKSQYERSSLGALVLNNLGANRASMIAMKYVTIRPDLVGRWAPIHLFMLLSSEQILNVLEVLKKDNLNQVLTAIQDRIDPNLKAINPAGNLSELNYSELTLESGEEWDSQELGRKNISVETIQR